MVEAGVLASRRAGASRPADKALEMPVASETPASWKKSGRGSGRQDAVLYGRRDARRHQFSKWKETTTTIRSHYHHSFVGLGVTYQ